MRYAQRAASSGPSVATRRCREFRSTDNLPAPRTRSSLANRSSRLWASPTSIPESMRGPTRAKVFLPLKLAESLHVMQPTDLREIARAASDQPVYSSISVRVKNPAQVQVVEDAIKKMGFGTFSILDASRGLRQFFAVLVCVPRNFRQPGA